MKNDLRTINEVAKLTGITVRTLHYYDEIGLLNPSDVLENGYRIYDDKCLKKLQQILFFKELGFELKKIKMILEDDTYNEKEALENHRSLLIMKVDRLKSLIDLVDENLKGENTMSFEEFDTAEIYEHMKKYEKEAKEKWGDTKAFHQSVEKTKNYTDADWIRLKNDSNKVYDVFVDLMKSGGTKEEKDAAVRVWQRHITDNYYDCSDETMLGLAEIYVNYPDFNKNLNKYKEGLAEFMSSAIKDCFS